MRSPHNQILAVKFALRADASARGQDPVSVGGRCGTIYLLSVRAWDAHLSKDMRREGRASTRTEE